MILKKFFRIAAALLIIFFAAPCFAVVTEGENKFSIEVPDGEGIYYYLPEGGNLFNDLKEKLLSGGRDVRLFVCKYTPDNEEAYSFTVTAIPFIEVFGEEASIIESLPESVADFAPEQKNSLIKYFIDKNGDAYKWDDIKTASIGGLNALLSVGKNGDKKITKSIYAASDGKKLIVVETVYKEDEEGTNLTDLSALQASFAIGDYVPPPSATPVKTESLEIIIPTVTPTPVPEPTVFIPKPTVEPTPAPTPSRNFAENLLFTIKSYLQNDPNFKYYIMGCAGVIISAVIAIVCVMAAKKKKENFYKTGEYEFDFFDQHVQNNGDEPYSQPEETHLKTDINDDIYNEAQRDSNYTENNEQEDAAPQYNNTEYKTEEDDELSRDSDFENDISKYTRQPGRDVNDISKNTMGNYSDTDLTIEIARAASMTTRNSEEATKPWKTEGTRMGRHKKKKK